MCGIVGFWDTKQRTSKEQLLHAVTQMRDKIVHRGPDGAGNWADDATGIAFGHRRLAILDLSEHGHQPMSSASGRYVISYNGEVYNHQELKQQLVVENLAPTTWQGHSDTEVILASFDAWGVEAALQKFVGMFAIALWDRQEKLLYLVRDRMGEKPLYYGWIDGYLLFGSELKALKGHFAWQQSVNPQAVNLLLQYNCIPAPYTIYENIHKLEPGHMLVINQDRHVTDKAYWQLKDVINNKTTTTFADPQHAVDALEAKLSEAVRLQMLADVPVGAFLSGGLDSSTVVALMQAQTSKPVKTFTIGFADAAYNEAEHAKAIATHLNTEHTELYLTPESTQAIIPELANFYDEPFADSSQVPTYIISKLAREHVTVSLSGDGGDELFAGYNRYTWVPNIWRKISFLPKPLRVLVSKMLHALTPMQWDKIFNSFGIIVPKMARLRSPGDKIHKLARLLDSASPYEIYYKLLTHWDIAKIDKGLTALLKDLNSVSLTENMMYIDSKRYLPDDILVKVDRAAMAVNLETRIPFLDHRVVEFAWSLPMDLKIRNGQSKWIVSQLLNRYVPEELYNRPKMGFGVPIDSWLRGPLKEWAQDLLTDSMLAKHDFLNVKAIQQKWHEHVSGTRNWQYHLWDILMFQSWYEAHYG